MFFHHLTRHLRLLAFALLLFLFFLTAFTLNGLQLLNYLLFSRWRPSLRRTLNNTLQEAILGCFLYLFESHCSVDFTLHLADPEIATSFSQKNGLLIVNHSHQLDAFFYWQACQILGTLGSIKAFTQATFRWMPVVGWMFWFNESIFLQANWRQDEGTIASSLGRLSRTPGPFMLAFAPEGVRFTPEKACDSQAFIEEYRLPITLKYHLLPRVKGFTSTLRHMFLKTDHSFTIYNAEFVCQVDGTYGEPTVEAFLGGGHFKIDCFIERLPCDALPTPKMANSAYTGFLYNLFQRKDRLVERFKETGRFTENIGRIQKKRRTMRQFALFLVFNVLLSGGLVYGCLLYAWITPLMIAKVAVGVLLILIGLSMKATLKMLQH